jgi:hypothetical protein
LKYADSLIYKEISVYVINKIIPCDKLQVFNGLMAILSVTENNMDSDSWMADSLTCLMMQIPVITLHSLEFNCNSSDVHNQLCIYYLQFSINETYTHQLRIGNYCGLDAIFHVLNHICITHKYIHHNSAREMHLTLQKQKMTFIQYVAQKEEELQTSSQHPQTLMHLSVLVIRHNMKSQCAENYNKLMLPSSLQAMVKFEYLVKDIQEMTQAKRLNSDS